MELLYVWIKKYKNIEEQGFNFSPKWHFHYNPETGKLNVEDLPHNGMDDFFDDKITNVTAVIGKNGSGKSNFIEFLVNRIANFTESSSRSGIDSSTDEMFIFDKFIYIPTSLTLSNKDELEQSG